MTVDEFMRFLRAAQSGPTRMGLSGPDRVMMYLVAAGTGFRASEIASLTPESFNLNSDPATVTVLAAYSKHRRQDIQPIRRDLAERLRPWLLRRVLRAPVFDTPRLSEKTAKFVRGDLKAAGVPYLDDDGFYADFHALRTTFVSAVGRTGASPKELQDLARHADPATTLRVYAKTQIHDLTRALDAMPGVPVDDENLVATGTAGEERQQERQQLQHDPSLPAAMRCESSKRVGGNAIVATPAVTAPRATRYRLSRRKGVARPPGLEPGTCGLEIRCSDSEGGGGAEVTEGESGTAAETAAVASVSDALAGLPADQRTTIRALLDLPAERRSAVFQAVRLMLGAEPS